MYVVTVTFEVKPEHAEAFREAVFAQARNSLDREERCRRFDVCTDTKQVEPIEDRTSLRTGLAGVLIGHFKGEATGR